MPSSPRPLTWRDLPIIHRYRQQAISLRSRDALTGRGNMLAQALAALLMATAGAIDPAHQPPLLGLAEPMPNEGLAWLLYLAPEKALHRTVSLHGLLEVLLRHPALAGIRALIAEAPLNAPWLPALRQGGLRVFAHRRTWRVFPASAPAAPGQWRWPRAEERWQAERLYANLTPPTTRRLLPPPAHAPTAVVYVEEGEVCGLATWESGPRGIWAAVWLDPNITIPHRTLAALATFLRPGRKPLYFAIHDTQSWLEGSLKTLQAQPGPHTALLARWTVAFQPETSPQPVAAGEVTPAFFAHWQPHPWPPKTPSAKV